MNTSSLPSALLPVWNKYDTLMKGWSAQYFNDDFHWQWVKAVCLNESALGTSTLPGVRTPRAEGDLDGLGIMQVTPGTAEQLAGYDVGTDLLSNDDLSIQLATKYLYQLSLQFNDDIRQTVMSYNQGAGNTMNGKEYAADYYARFLTHLQWVQAYT